MHGVVLSSLTMQCAGAGYDDAHAFRGVSARDLREDIPSLGMEAASALLSVVGVVIETGILPKEGAGWRMSTCLRVS